MDIQRIIPSSVRSEMVRWRQTESRSGDWSSQVRVTTHHPSLYIKVGELIIIITTGGPCGGKTTAQNRLATFFESLGWRVFRVPETATILLNGGVRIYLLKSLSPNSKVCCPKS